MLQGGQNHSQETGDVDCPSAPSQGPAVTHLYPLGAARVEGLRSPIWHTTAPITPGQGPAPAPPGRSPLPRAATFPEAFLGSGHYWERQSHLSLKDWHRPGWGRPSEGQKGSCRTIQRLQHQPVSFTHCKHPRQLSAIL